MLRELKFKLDRSVSDNAKLLFCQDNHALSTTTVVKIKFAI